MTFLKRLFAPVAIAFAMAFFVAPAAMANPTTITPSLETRSNEEIVTCMNATLENSAVFTGSYANRLKQARHLVSGTKLSTPDGEIFTTTDNPSPWSNCAGPSYAQLLTYAKGLKEENTRLRALAYYTAKDAKSGLYVKQTWQSRATAAETSLTAMTMDRDQKVTTLKAAKSADKVKSILIVLLFLAFMIACFRARCTAGLVALDRNLDRWLTKRFATKTKSGPASK